MKKALTVCLSQKLTQHYKVLMMMYNSLTQSPFLDFNTLSTGNADLRFYITTVQDG